MAEPEITTMSQKGQVVIPQTIREKLGIKPKTRLLVYGYQDTIVLKKLYVPDLREEWERIKRIIEERNKKYGKLTEEDVRREVKAARKSKKG